VSRLVLLVTSPRVAPGLLTHAAWNVLRSGWVLAEHPSAHPQTGALSAAGVEVSAARPHARELLQRARDTEQPVVWLVGPTGDQALTDAVAAEVGSAAATGQSLPEVEVLHGSYDLPGARLLDLVAVMDRLRSPGGCPWDAQQTHRSLVTYLVEETYETLEAIESDDDEHLREELGDLLLQVVFHARIAEERTETPWSIDDVAAGVVEKLIRRHPHVFGTADAPPVEHLDRLWEEQKATEKARTSALEGIPLAQPALSLASKLMHRAEKAGIRLDTPDLDPHGDIGDLLLAVVALARSRGVDAEQSLRAAVRRYADAVRQAEAAGPNTTLQ
jgi:XTP/dITP diphosphohydrolase